MSLAALGWCGANADSLTQSGDATITWTPDGVGGGVLSVAMPAGAGCSGPSGGTGAFNASLTLRRYQCGRKFRFQVAGSGHGFALSTTVEVFDQNNVRRLQMQPPSTGGSACGGARGLVVTIGGSNPKELSAICGGGGTRGFRIAAFGGRTQSQSYSFTVTVTAL